jgi:hypothetical protein
VAKWIVCKYSVKCANRFSSFRIWSSGLVMWLLNLQVPDKVVENLIYIYIYIADGVWIYVCMCICRSFIQVSCNIDGNISTFPYFGEVF